MRRPEAVVFALRAFGEAREAAALAERPDLVPPRGQNLVRIGLVADIPDQAVARRVEQIVERDGELDDAEPCPKMSASHGNCADRLGPQLVGHLSEPFLVQAAQIGGGDDGVEDRSGRCHDCNIIVPSTGSLDDASSGGRVTSIWLLILASKPPNGSTCGGDGRELPAGEIVVNAVHSRMVHSVQWLIRPLDPQSPERTRHAEIKDCVRGQYLRKPRMAGGYYRCDLGSVVWLLLSSQLYD